MSPVMQCSARMTQYNKKGQKRKPKIKITDIHTVEMEEPPKDQQRTLHTKLETATIYRVHATFGCKHPEDATKESKPFQHPWIISH